MRMAVSEVGAPAEPGVEEAARVARPPWARAGEAEWVGARAARAAPVEPAAKVAPAGAAPVARGEQGESADPVGKADSPPPAREAR